MNLLYLVVVIFARKWPQFCSNNIDKLRWLILIILWFHFRSIFWLMFHPCGYCCLSELEFIGVIRRTITYFLCTIQHQRDVLYSTWTQRSHSQHIFISMSPKRLDRTWHLDPNIIGKLMIWINEFKRNLEHIYDTI